MLKCSMTASRSDASTTAPPLIIIIHCICPGAFAQALLKDGPQVTPTDSTRRCYKRASKLLREEAMSNMGHAVPQRA